MTAFDTDFGILLADDSALGSGGRGSVLPLVLISDCTVGFPAEDLVCKVVEPRFRSIGRERKVALLEGIGAGVGSFLSAGNHKVADAVAWPLCNIYEDGAWAGYVMLKARGRSLSEVREDEKVPFGKKVELAGRMCGLVESMHRLGIVVGDVSMANMMYDAVSDRLVMVDVDSAQVVDEASRSVYPTVESREKSPEMLEGVLGETTLSSRSDDFLVAVEAFRMLFGAHPFDEYRKDMPVGKVRAENVRARHFAYELSGAGCGTAVFGDELAELFRRSFSGNYHAIPSARAYAEALRELVQVGCEPCPRCGMAHVKQPSFLSKHGFSILAFLTGVAGGLINWLA